MLITVNKCCAQTFVTVSCEASKGHEAHWETGWKRFCWCVFGARWFDHRTVHLQILSLTVFVLSDLHLQCWLNSNKVSSNTTGDKNLCVLPERFHTVPGAGLGRDHSHQDDGWSLSMTNEWPITKWGTVKVWFVGVSCSAHWSCSIEVIVSSELWLQCLPLTQRLLHTDSSWPQLLCHKKAAASHCLCVCVSVGKEQWSHMTYSLCVCFPTRLKKTKLTNRTNYLCVCVCVCAISDSSFSSWSFCVCGWVSHVTEACCWSVIRTDHHPDCDYCHTEARVCLSGHFSL